MSKAESDARELIAAGYMQISRKFRTVNRLPEGKLGKAALAEVDSELAERLSNRDAAGYYLRVYQKGKLTLDVETFEAFKRLKGETAP